MVGFKGYGEGVEHKTSNTVHPDRASCIGCWQVLYFFILSTRWPKPVQVDPRLVPAAVQSAHSGGGVAEGVT